MSYCRFGWDGSDVYVFTSRDGLECCGCALQERRWVTDPDSSIGGYLVPVGEIVPTTFASNAEMVAHLMIHRAAGHTVPQYAIDALRDPEDAAENEAIWRQYR